jgi:tetratricopeptide (TPR) repeat protein
MKSDLNSRIDRYMNRELHPAAARALAHEALDDSDLFDELSAVALVRQALESPATTDRGLAQSALDDENLFETLVARGAIESSLEDPRFHAVLPTQHRHKPWTIAVAGAAVAGAALLTFLLVRPSSRPVQLPAQPARAVVTKPAVAPTILLTRDLQPERSTPAPIFRGAEAPSRPPKSEGSIVSIEDGVATVNLGSIDGLAKGTELSGRIVITTVFRDRARGKIVDPNGMQANDPVRVPTREHLNATLQYVEALAAGGDLKSARDVARNAIATGSPGETRQLLERLAALDYQAGASDAARDHYEVAVNNFDQPPAASSNEQAETLASYAALLLQSGDRDRAGELLQKALAKATDSVLRSQILNNLGAVAELGGDRAQAASYYNQALTQTASKSDRNVVEANLARVQNNRHP